MFATISNSSVVHVYKEETIKYFKKPLKISLAAGDGNQIFFMDTTLSK